MLFPRIRRLAASLCFITYLSSCTSWRAQTGSPSEVFAKQKIHDVRVTLANGKVEELQSPRIENDSLIGGSASTRAGHPPTRRAIPIDSVKSLAISRTDGTKTALLIAGVGITALLIAAVIAAASWDGPLGTGGGGTGSDGTVTSCPLVYSWDGTAYRLDSGTFGGAIMPALARTDLDNLDLAVSDHDTLRLRMTNELNETDFVDAIAVLAVDHEPSVTVAPSGDGTLHTLGDLTMASSAIDLRGNDALDRIRARDGWSWESRPSRRDTSRSADIRDGIDVTFPRPAGARSAKLVIDGNNTPWAAYMIQELVRAHGKDTRAWYDSVAASNAMALNLGAMMAREGFLDVQLKVGPGWVHQNFVWEAGPEVSKRQILNLDLSSIEGDSVTIRLESAPMFWLLDQVALDYSADRPIRVTQLTPATAIDQSGRDQRSLLGRADHGYLALQTGDHTDLSFVVPTLPQGLVRSYVLKSTGYYEIRAAATAEPDLVLLNQITTRRHGASRIIVARSNEALRDLMRVSP